MCDGPLDSVCRLCLRDNFSLKHIFNSGSPSNEPIFKIMEKIYDLKICEGDGLPSQICVPCMWKVLEFDTYRKNVRHAEKEMRKLLSRTCDNSNEVSEEGTYNTTELTAEGEMNIASDPLEGIENDAEVPIKDEIDIVEWEMPQDMLPKEDILERVTREAGEEVLKVTEISTGNVFIELKHPENDVRTEESEESQPSESSDINSPECLGQTDENFESISSINDSSVVGTPGISGKNKKKREESVKIDLFTEKESFLSSNTKSDGGDNSAKAGSSGSGIAVQDEKKKPFVCYICKKGFFTKQNLGDHVTVHRDDRPFKCGECGQSFKLESTKTVHELRHLKKREDGNSGSTKKSLVCEICNKELSTRKSFRNHSYLHQNKYSCSFCGKRCTSKYHLDKHLRIHTNEKPFTCEVCQRSFNQKDHLKRHVPTHFDDCPFQCGVCDKRFKTKQQKNQHELYHSKV